MEPKKNFFSVSLFLILSNELYNVSRIFLSNFIQKTPLIGKKVLFGPIVEWMGGSLVVLRCSKQVASNQLNFTY